MPGIETIQRIIEFITYFIGRAVDFFSANMPVIFLFIGAAVLLAAAIFLAVRLGKRHRIKKKEAGEEKPREIKKAAPQYPGSQTLISVMHIRAAPRLTRDPLDNDQTLLAAAHDLARMVSEAVMKTGGLLESCADGAFIAFWGERAATGSPAHDALNAVRSALLLRVAIEQRRKESGYVFPAAIGISSGKAVSCPMNIETRGRRYLLGEPMFFAVKAREAAEHNSVDIIMTAKTWRLVKEYVVFEETPPLKSSAGDEESRLFAVLNLRQKRGAALTPPRTISELKKQLSIPANAAL
ncbi:MAG: hypothetical protein LBC77_05130 [Spirochaetaceae bacterium]|nr:hypothetical protein [Spirochaetaceae bacterium]